MSVTEDIVRQPFIAEVTIWPTYLNCPYCPAQAFPVVRDVAIENKAARQFRCPADHVFFVHAEKKS